MVEKGNTKIQTAKAWLTGQGSATDEAVKDVPCLNHSTLPPPPELEPIPELEQFQFRFRFTFTWRTLCH